MKGHRQVFVAFKPGYLWSARDLITLTEEACDDVQLVARDTKRGYLRAVLRVESECVPDLVSSFQFLTGKNVKIKIL